MNQMDTAVVLIIFNRPSLTRIVFNEIRKVMPKKLFVIADGPRPDYDHDKIKCAEVREIIDAVDWECSVEKNYADQNMGLKRRVSTGLDWVFQNADKAIILEDDCVPDPSFFPFCEQLLNRFESDSRIFTITGQNLQKRGEAADYSYYFSIYNHCWGWATWRRAWRYFDYKMSLWPEVKKGDMLAHMFQKKSVRKYWKKVFEGTFNDENSSWAYRWTLACWLQNGLTVIPNKNLVSNIGFGTDSTHTKVVDKSLSNSPRFQMEFPFRHPSIVLRNSRADRYTESQYYDSSLEARIIRRLQRFI